MSPWQQLAAELDCLEREALESIAAVFEAGRQRLTVMAIEPGPDPRAALRALPWVPVRGA